MNTNRAMRGVAAVELLVVAAAGALLLTMTITGARGIRARGRQASCLENLHRIGAATLAYSIDDPRNQAVPLHRMHVSIHMGDGFPPEYAWRTALPFSFGGRTATVPMPTAQGNVTVMTDPAGYWGAKTKPLNSYLAGPASVGLETFHCPADTGFVEDWGWEAPAEAAGIPCFDILGNSYRSTRLGIVWASGSAAHGFVTSAPHGHTAASLEGPLAETVLYCDPFFYDYSHSLSNDPDLPPLPGWHGELMADNVAYCDGSARQTQLGELYDFTDEELDEMGVTADFPSRYFLRRGPNWRMDVYPTPGAVIQVYQDNGWLAFDVVSSLQAAGYRGWPFADFQVNEAP
ncbi:MAG: hypothetical protein PVJ57_19575 [Phycisphaerae bacterium]|jgi:hypothetical protein